MRRTAIAVSVVVLASLVATVAAAAPSQSREQAPDRGFVPAGSGHAPTTTVPPKAIPAPSGYEDVSARAIEAADIATAIQRSGAEPVPVVLPSVLLGDSDKMFVPEEMFHEPPGLGADKASGDYQSDRVLLTDYPNDVYAIDFFYWMRTPQTNEWNKCDSTTSSNNCFWFAHMNNSTDYSGSSIHSGPKRGSSASGESGSSWRVLVSGYVNGNHVGGQGPTNLPQGKWVRVRTWRIATGYDSWPPYTPWSTWGVWTEFSGQEPYQGSLTLDGHWFSGSYMASEIYEPSNPCSTDFVGVYMDNPRYWSASQGLRAFPHGTADYEATCSNTSWRVIGAPDFIHDGREVTRTIGHGVLIW